MYAGLTRDGLRNLESKIDKRLAGRDPKSPELEKDLQNSIKYYTGQVMHHNIWQGKKTGVFYTNKYTKEKNTSDNKNNQKLDLFELLKNQSARRFTVAPKDRELGKTEIKRRKLV